MVPTPINKGHPDYVLTTLLVPFLKANMQLADDRIADPKVVDKTWMISTGVPIRPFGFLDIIGPIMPYNLNKVWG
jgi:3-hydroxyacyl-CoA dehydrogenase